MSTATYKVSYKAPDKEAKRRHETYVHNLGFLLAHNLEIPLPHLGSDGLTDGAQNSKVLHLIPDVLVASPLEQPQSGRRHVELRDLVLVDDIPVPGEVGVRRCTFKHHSRHTEEQRRIHNISMARNPTDISSTEEPITVVNVKDILSGDGSAQEIAASGVHNTLGLSGRSRRVKEEQWVLRVHGLRGDICRPLVGLLVPPEIAPLSPRDIGTSALVDKDVPDVGALLQSIVDNLLGANQLATALALVRGYDDLALGIDDPVAQRVGRETGENDRVDGSDSGAGEEGDESLGNHGEVDGYGVALADAHLLEDVGGLGDLAKELAVGDIATFAGLVGFVDDGDLVGVLDGVPVDAVVRGVELAFQEPGVIAFGERAAVHSLEILGPAQQLAGLPPPELIRLGDGLLVELLVLLEACIITTASAQARFLGSVSKPV